MKPLLALLAGLWLVGCASMKTTTILTERDHDQAVRLTVGQTLLVKLASNPTTGYDWTERKAPDPVMQPVGAQTYLPNFAPAGTVGVGGTVALEFKAMNAGQQTLQFDYVRAWEKNTPPAKTVAFNVTVSP
jgi:inhibitor of cysteine peptidase